MGSHTIYLSMRAEDPPKNPSSRWGRRFLSNPRTPTRHSPPGRIAATSAATGAALAQLHELTVSGPIPTSFCERRVAIESRRSIALQFVHAQDRLFC